MMMIRLVKIKSKIMSDTTGCPNKQSDCWFNFFWTIESLIFDELSTKFNHEKFENLKFSAVFDEELEFFELLEK